MIKHTLYILSFISFIYFSATAECEDITKMVKAYDTNKTIDEILKTGTKQAFTTLLSKIVGKAGGVITGILTPSKIGTPYDAFMSSLKRIEVILSKDNINWNQFTREFNNLKTAGQGVKIERLFGDKEDCYNGIDQIIKLYTSILSKSKELH